MGNANGQAKRWTVSRRTRDHIEMVGAIFCSTKLQNYNTNNNKAVENTKLECWLKELYECGMLHATPFAKRAHTQAKSVRPQPTKAVAKSVSARSPTNTIAICWLSKAYKQMNQQNHEYTKHFKVKE
ncbi:unnamed protein product [Ceratitis capitata]|uniref:(Mediterranean fruit fly) hypothetical protein n=1 Tax=Ceratitis capitata TaxID=7213 RepID=A0A811VEW8_CERCA|nr:unnamed protein product [Ceratitis capitata]